MRTNLRLPRAREGQAPPLRYDEKRTSLHYDEMRLAFYQNLRVKNYGLCTKLLPSEHLQFILVDKLNTAC